MLKIQIFEKKGNCFREKNYLKSFSSNIEYNKPQRTFPRDPEGIVAVAVEIMRAFFGTMRLSKTQIFEKRMQLFR